ncbi:unnamed protein product [Acanthocheilonema viteae]|uniref:Spaetzle domain-containing protein n=1 Tax=Acanthocheilonema viteae TaxID=6277 RepID=A0A498SW40_ACAVI|nr:unnamed protein product [Acanthocheilonema viteae]
MHFIAEFAESTYETILETVFTNSSDLFSNESFPKFSIDKDMRKSISEQCAREEKIHNLYKLVQNRIGDILPKRWLSQHLQSCHPPSRDPGPKRIVNQALCQTERTVVHLNDENFEFFPPFYSEIRCKVPKRDGDSGNKKEHTCLRGTLRCVQRYEDRIFARRQRGDIEYNQHKISKIPSACDCMWPVDIYGKIKHENFKI